MTEAVAPPPPVTKRGSGLKWFIGCGLGCLILVLIGAAVIGGFAYWGLSIAPKKIGEEYGKLKSENKIPAEAQPVFDKLMAMGEQEGVSILGKGLIAQVFMSTLADQQVSESDIAMAEDAVKLLESKPAIGLDDLKAFTDSHPSLKAPMRGGQAQPEESTQPGP